MKSKFLIAVCLLVAFAGCAQNGGTQNSGTNNPEYRKISAQEAKKMLDANPNAILLDVRTEAEYQQKHIPGAILLPDYEVKSRAADVLPDKGALILVYCHSGGRSAGAAKALVGMGYTGVYDMGGIVNWPY